MFYPHSMVCHLDRPPVCGLTLAFVGDGESSVYNLTEPHVYLHDCAIVKNSMEQIPGSEAPVRTDLDLRDKPTRHDPGERRTAEFEKGLNVFVRGLLKGLGRPADASFQSPADLRTPVAMSFLNSSIEAAKAVRMDAVSSSPQQRATFFNIHTGGAKVATIELMRASYNLGDSIPVAIKFQEPNGACFGVFASLETVEEVSPALALRSEASIFRATRRVHAQSARHTHCSQTTNLELVVPRHATPDFTTSEIKMRWILHFGFATRPLDASHSETQELLEPTFLDERGRISSGVQEMSCGNLDVTVPIRVFGCPSDKIDFHKPSCMLI